MELLIFTAIAAGTTTVYAFYTENNEQYVGSISIKVTSSAQVNPSVTVYDGNAGYALTDDPDEGRDSIADQIDDWVENYYGMLIRVIAIICIHIECKVIAGGSALCSSGKRSGLKNHILIIRL